MVSDVATNCYLILCISIWVNKTKEQTTNEEISQ